MRFTIVLAFAVLAPESKCHRNTQCKTHARRHIHKRERICVKLMGRNQGCHDPLWVCPGVVPIITVWIAYIFPIHIAIQYKITPVNTLLQYFH